MIINSPADLNVWQYAFVQWNHERLGITQQQSFDRYSASWNAFPGGHAGQVYRSFMEKAHETMQTFHDDSLNEVHAAYIAHANPHFLRMLTYVIPIWSANNPIVRMLLGRPTRVIDYGCGLAQISITLADALRKLGSPCELFLCDIPSLRLDFLHWFCRRLDIPCRVEIIPSPTRGPELPDSDMIIATEVMEHIYNPEEVLGNFHRCLRSGGILTNLADHHQEFFHVSCKLEGCRKAVTAWGYTLETDAVPALPQFQLYVKPAGWGS